MLCGMEELLMEMVSRSAPHPRVRVLEMEGWGTPQNTPSPLSPWPGHPLCVTSLGQPCPGIRVGKGLPGTGVGGAQGAPRAGRRTPAARIPRWLRLRAAGPGRGRMLGIRVPEQRETGANTNNK